MANLPGGGRAEVEIWASEAAVAVEISGFE